VRLFNSVVAQFIGLSLMNQATTILPHQGTGILYDIMRSTTCRLYELWLDIHIKPRNLERILEMNMKLLIGLLALGVIMLAVGLVLLFSG